MEAQRRHQWVWVSPLAGRVRPRTKTHILHRLHVFEPPAKPWHKTLNCYASYCSFWHFKLVQDRLGCRSLACLHVHVLAVGRCGEVCVRASFSLESCAKTAPSTVPSLKLAFAKAQPRGTTGGKLGRNGLHGLETQPSFLVIVVVAG